LFFSPRRVSFCRLQILIEVLHNDFSVDLAGLDHVEADVTIDRGLNAAVTEKLPNQLVFTGAAFENEGSGSMPELMRRHSHAGVFPNSLGDLAAEGDFALGAFT
jgi:hypothetical protein